jgi:hypothetical protein
MVSPSTDEAQFVHEIAVVGAGWITRRRYGSARRPFPLERESLFLDGHHKIQAAAQLGAALKMMTVLSTTMGKARPETVLQLVCELAGRRWAGPDLLRWSR